MSEEADEVRESLDEARETYLDPLQDRQGLGWEPG